jgi:hypothetical protein
MNLDNNSVVAGSIRIRAKSLKSKDKRTPVQFNPYRNTRMFLKITFDNEDGYLRIKLRLPFCIIETFTNLVDSSCVQGLVPNAGIECPCKFVTWIFIVYLKRWKTTLAIECEVLSQVESVLTSRTSSSCSRISTSNLSVDKMGCGVDKKTILIISVNIVYNFTSLPMISINCCTTGCCRLEI